jgi:hypothetical protein
MSLSNTTSQLRPCGLRAHDMACSRVILSSPSRPVAQLNRSGVHNSSGRRQQQQQCRRLGATHLPGHAQTNRNPDKCGASTNSSWCPVCAGTGLHSPACHQAATSQPTNSAQPLTRQVLPPAVLQAPVRLGCLAQGGSQVDLDVISLHLLAAQHGTAHHSTSCCALLPCGTCPDDVLQAYLLHCRSSPPLERHRTPTSLTLLPPPSWLGM